MIRYITFSIPLLLIAACGKSSKDASRGDNPIISPSSPTAPSQPEEGAPGGNPDGIIRLGGAKSEITYDAAGKVIRERYHTDSGTEERDGSEWTRTLGRKEGNFKVTESYRSSDRANWTLSQTSTYQVDGKMLEQVQFNSDGKAVLTISYDDQGQQVLEKRERFDENNTKLETNEVVTEISYDEKMRVIKKVRKQGNKEKTASRSFDADGRVIFISIENNEFAIDYDGRKTTHKRADIIETCRYREEEFSTALTRWQDKLEFEMRLDNCELLFLEKTYRSGEKVSTIHGKFSTQDKSTIWEQLGQSEDGKPISGKVRMTNYTLKFETPEGIREATLPYFDTTITSGDTTSVFEVLESGAAGPTKTRSRIQSSGFVHLSQSITTLDAGNRRKRLSEYVKSSDDEPWVLKEYTDYAY